MIVKLLQHICRCCSCSQHQHAPAHLPACPATLPLPACPLLVAPTRPCSRASMAVSSAGVGALSLRTHTTAADIGADIEDTKRSLRRAEADMETCKADMNTDEAIADDPSKTPEERERANRRLDAAFDGRVVLEKRLTALQERLTALYARIAALEKDRRTALAAQPLLPQPPTILSASRRSGVRPAGGGAADNAADYQACFEFALKCAPPPQPLRTVTFSDELVVQTSDSMSAARTEELNKHIFPMHCFPAEFGTLLEVDLLPLESMVTTLQAAESEASIVQDAVDALLNGVLALCAGDPAGFVLNASGAPGGGLMPDHPRTDVSPQDCTPGGHGIFAMVDSAPTPLLLLAEAASNEPDENSVGKLIRDLEANAAVSKKAHLPGVIMSQHHVHAYELFKVPSGILVLKFADVPTSDWKRVIRVLVHAVKQGTFLGAAGTADGASADAYRFVSFLGHGLTSVVFATASPDWPVAKVLLASPSRSDPVALAQHEVTQVDKLFSSHAVENVDHFMDATLDPARTPRTSPRSASAPVKFPRAAPPCAQPIVFYSRRCHPFDASQLMWSHEAFGDTLGQLLDACEQMHLAGVVHNDLRESNLMVSTAGGTDGRSTLVLGDFGYSRTIGDGVWSGGTTVTASPHLLLELARRGGREATASPDDDLWSVATLCLHASDPLARQTSRAIALYSPPRNEPAATAVLLMWGVWERFDRERYGAVCALLDPHRTATTMATPGTGNVYERLHRILSVQPRPCR